MSAGPFNQQGINYYVPKMSAAPGFDDDGSYAASLGTPSLAAVNAIIITANGAITNAAKVFNAASAGLASVLPFTIDAAYGRNITITGGTAGDNAVLSVRGVDYLGQPITENLTLNGTSSVIGLKAFKRIDSISVPAGNANASSSIQMGTGTRLGLPWKTHIILGEASDDTPATVGTFNAAVLTDPATATTGDPRGTYIPSTTTNGVKVITVFARGSRATNAADNGGLQGIKHFA